MYACHLAGFSFIRSYRMDRSYGYAFAARIDNLIRIHYNK